jgi:hypothetical protein
MVEDNSGRSVIHSAVIFGKEQTVKRLLIHNSIRCDPKDKYSRITSSYTVITENVDIVRLLQARNDIDTDSKTIKIEDHPLLRLGEATRLYCSSCWTTAASRLTLEIKIIGRRYHGQR